MLYFVFVFFPQVCEGQRKRKQLTERLGKIAPEAFPVISAGALTLYAGERHAGSAIAAAKLLRCPGDALHRIACQWRRALGRLAQSRTILQDLVGKLRAYTQYRLPAGEDLSPDP